MGVATGGGDTVPRWSEGGGIIPSSNQISMEVYELLFLSSVPVILRKKRSYPLSNKFFHYI